MKLIWYQALYSQLPVSGGLSQLKNLFFHLYFSECKAELFIPFCNDTNYYSGNNVHVLNQNIFIFGNGQGYFNSKSRLIVDLFSNIDLYTGLVIRMRFIQDMNAGGTHVILALAIVVITRLPWWWSVAKPTFILRRNNTTIDRFITFHFPVLVRCPYFHYWWQIQNISKILYTVFTLFLH